MRLIFEDIIYSYAIYILLALFVTFAFKKKAFIFGENIDRKLTLLFQISVIIFIIYKTLFFYSGYMLYEEMREFFIRNLLLINSFAIVTLLLLAISFVKIVWNKTLTRIIIALTILLYPILKKIVFAKPINPQTESWLGYMIGDCQDILFFALQVGLVIISMVAMNWYYNKKEN